MLHSVNPASGQEIAAYNELTLSEIDGKLGLASAAYSTWRVSPMAERIRLLEKLAHVYETHKTHLAYMVTAEMGKTLAASIQEVEKCIAAFRYYAEEGPAMLEPSRVDLKSGGTAELHRLPLGPVLAVMPWNYPLWQVVRFLAPTILAGNVGLLKHASIVQGTAGLLQDMMFDAGAHEGLFQNLAVKSDKIPALIADPRIVAVTLTGSEGAGKSVAEQAGKNLKKVVLELGGSDPFIVMPSANLDEAVQQAVKARIQNSGQSCVCGKRMIVHAAIYAQFLEKFATAMEAVKVGDPLDTANDMGPLSSAAQRDTVMHQLGEATQVGARLYMGGKALPGAGAYVSAGILTDVPFESALTREEIFGPIAMLYRARDIDDAINIANHIPYGLGSAVWTEEPEEQKRFIRDIEAGMTAINMMLSSAPEAPFGGIKRSGYGRELGPFGLHEFTNLKAVMRKAHENRA